MAVVFVCWFILVGFILLLDGLLYGEMLGKLWCALGRHQYYDIEGGGFKDFIVPLEHCRLCKKLKNPNKTQPVKHEPGKLRLVK